MTLPVTFAFNIGFMVAVGILLDTFIVRTIMVPAAVELLGDRIWWPSTRRAAAAPCASTTSPPTRPTSMPGAAVEATTLERPPELDEVGRAAQVGARRLLEAAQAVAQRVGVHVQGAGGLLDAHPAVEPRAQRRLELVAEAAERGQRLEVAAANASPSASSARIAGRIERSASENTPCSPNASAVCSARLASANAPGSVGQPRRRPEADAHAGDGARRGRARCRRGRGRARDEPVVAGQRERRRGG